MLRASSCGFGHDSSPPVTLPQDPCHSFPVFFFLPYGLHMFVISFFFFFFLSCLITSPSVPSCQLWVSLYALSQAFLINALAEMLLLLEKSFSNIVSSTVR